MVAQKGRDMLLKLDLDSNGNFETVAGLRTKALRFNAELVDVTDSQSLGMWRELLGGAGLKTATLSGSGLFKDATSDAQVRSQFFDGILSVWQIVIPDFGFLEGIFQISSLEYVGQHDSELRFDIELQSAGQITFTAV